MAEHGKARYEQPGYVPMVPLSVSVDLAVRDRLVEWAGRMGMSRTELARMAIIGYLDGLDHGAMVRPRADSKELIYKIKELIYERPEECKGCVVPGNTLGEQCLGCPVVGTGEGV